MAKKETGLRYEPLYKPSGQRHKEKTREKSTRRMLAALVRRVTCGLFKDRHR